jgi:regulator of sigma E protease
MLDILVSSLFWPVSGLILISIVITVHELGHYWVGRLFDAAAESFAIGFGKPIVEMKDKRGTRWRINWLPLGGFVKFVGEIQAPTDRREPMHTEDANHVTVLEGATPDEPSVKLVGKPYNQLGPLQRLAVSLGGPFANFIFAIFVFAMMAMTLGVPQAKEVYVTGVVAGGAAEKAGFKAGDVVVAAAGKPVRTSDDITRVTVLSAGEPVRYQVRRDGAVLDLVATPVEKVEVNEDFKVKEKLGRIGLNLEHRGVEIRKLNPIEAVAHGVDSTSDAIGATVNVLRRLITGRDGLDKLSGPLGIFTLADNVTDMHMKQQGVSLDQKVFALIISWLQLAALLSIGVGFFNLLPIPVLDGGAVVMCVAEAITGREVPEKVQRVGLTIGVACLISFALVITWQDIGRIVPGWPGWPGAP